MRFLGRVIVFAFTPVELDDIVFEVIMVDFYILRDGVTLIVKAEE